MAFFQSSAQLQQVLGDFFQELTTNSEIAPKLKESGLKIRFNYTDPELAISLDLSKSPIAITFNDEQLKPDVEMNMKADVAHRFWFGKVNLIAALTRREMVAKGPIPKILKLLPAIKPAYRLYPEYLKSKGLDHLLIA